MEPLKIDLPPGFVKTESSLASAGRYVDGDGIRFYDGKPQKIGGRVRLTASPMIGTARGIVAWNNQTSEQILGVGTSSKLYEINNFDFLLNDITPFILTTTVVNPISTVSGSNAVHVNVPNNLAVLGQFIDISGATTVGGLTVNGSFQITKLIDANNVEFLSATPATSTVTAAGGTVTISLELPPGLVDPASGFGWGAGAWGEGSFGTPRAVSSISFTPRFWALDHFGRILIACPMGGSLYSFDPGVLPIVRAAIIPTAPTMATGVVVTSDEITIAFGTNFGGTQDLMQFWAAAQGDFTNWDVTAIAGPNGTPSVVNELQSGTQIVGALDLGIHITLMWTDTSLYALQYTGSQFVFNTERVGKECGLLGPLAATVVDTIAYWMGNNGFYLYSGGVAPIPNQDDILDFVFDQIPDQFGVKSVCWYNERFKEIWFGFVGAGSTEPNTYAVYNTLWGYWFTGTIIDETCATRFTGSDSRPIIVRTDGFIYQLENGLDNNGVAQNWSLQTAPLELGLGEQNYTAQSIVMDMQRQVGNITAVCNATDRTPAQQTIIDTATVTITPSDGRDDLRISGRQIDILWSGSGLGCDVRFGLPKVLITTLGGRQ